MRCLLVEDNPADATLVRYALQAVETPVELSVVGDGQAALDFLQQCAPYKSLPCPDVILLDLNLPRKNGEEVLHEIKEHPQWKIIPVVMFTNTGEPHAVRRCYMLGANAFLTKPGELEAYFAVVHLFVAFWHACQLSELGSRDT